MSKNINWSDHPLTDEEKAWFKSRREEWKIERNEMIFNRPPKDAPANGGDGSASDGSSEPDVDLPGNNGSEEHVEEPTKMTIAQVNDMKVDQLRDELDAAGIDSGGLKADLVKRFVDALRERGQLIEDDAE